MDAVVYSPDAIRDLTDIWDYVARDSAFQGGSAHPPFQIRMEYLAANNLLGRPRAELAANCRSVPMGRYCIYYRPTEEGIEVLRLLHSSRDIRQIKFPGGQ